MSEEQTFVELIRDLTKVHTSKSQAAVMVGNYIQANYLSKAAVKAAIPKKRPIFINTRYTNTGTEVEVATGREYNEAINEITKALGLEGK